MNKQWIKRQKDRQIDIKNLFLAHVKTSNTMGWQCWWPRYNVSVLFLYGGFHVRAQQGSFLPA